MARLSISSAAGLKHEKSFKLACSSGGLMRGSKFAVLIVLTLATILAAASQTAPSTTKHPFTFKDMMARKRIGAPSVSPDGKWVLFTAMDVNLDENKRINHIWVVPIAGGDARP